VDEVTDKLAKVSCFGDDGRLKFEVESIGEDGGWKMGQREGCTNARKARKRPSFLGCGI
jgi:hypothetical protein